MSPNTTPSAPSVSAAPAFLCSARFCWVAGTAAGRVRWAAIRRTRLSPGLFVAATLLTAAWPGVAYGETINVGTTVDTIAADGACSLREAVVAANTDTPQQECPSGNGADTIEL